jgi:hypothetical protein
VLANAHNLVAGNDSSKLVRNISSFFDGQNDGADAIDVLVRFEAKSIT